MRDRYEVISQTLALWRELIPEDDIEVMDSTIRQRGADNVPYAEQILTTRGPFWIVNFDALREDYGVSLVPFMEPWLYDSDERVRRTAYGQIAHLCREADDVAVRQELIYTLLARTRDDERGAHFVLGALSRGVLNKSTGGALSDESTHLIDRQMIRALGEDSMNHQLRSDWVLLGGIADLKQNLPALRDYIVRVEPKLREKHREHVESLLRDAGLTSNEQGAEDLRKLAAESIYWRGSLLWTTVRAAARMGNSEDVDKCIQMVEAVPEPIRQRYFADLSYVRSATVVEYLDFYLQTGDDSIKSGSGCVVIQGSAHLAALALADMLEGFPGSIKGRSASLSRKREWMREQTAWRIVR